LSRFDPALTKDKRELFAFGGASQCSSNRVIAALLNVTDLGLPVCKDFLAAIGGFLLHILDGHNVNDPLLLINEQFKSCFAEALAEAASTNPRSLKRRPNR
jgi:hypothetical protein